MGLSPVVNYWQIEYANREEPFQDPASPVLFIWLIWFIWLVWINQKLDRSEKPDELDRPGFS
jgi:hypothetical protein